MPFLVFFNYKKPLCIRGQAEREERTMEPGAIVLVAIIVALVAAGVSSSIKARKGKKDDSQ